MPKIDYKNLPESVDESKVQEVVSAFASKLDIDLSNQLIEILFFQQDEMQKLNKKMRDIDSSTDVLSFPQASTPSPEQIFGTIVISPEDAAEREEDIYDLIKHGLLHLAGYDHETDQAAWQMAAKAINHQMGL